MSRIPRRRHATLGPTALVRPVAEKMFADSSPRRLLRRLDDFCKRHLQSSIDAGVFLRASENGFAFGLRLENGRSIVIKAHDSTWPREFLNAVHGVQAHIHENGFPVPRPLLGPQPLGSGLALAETLIEAGTHPDPRHPRARRAMAAGLAWQANLAQELGALRGIDAIPQFFSDEDGWPSAAAIRAGIDPELPGAEWIDDAALTARSRCAGGDMFPGHMEWNAKHLRLDGDRVAVAYDWDSLNLLTEPQLVGMAGALHTITTPALGGIRLATPTETAAFIDDYDRARSSPLSASDRDRVRAAAVYTLAFGARHEHTRAKRRPQGFATQLAAHLGHEGAA